MPNAKDCALRIKALAKDRKVSINRLLSECGLTKSLVYDMEHRNSMPGADKLAKIAGFLGVSVDYIISGKQNELKESSAADKAAEDDDDININDLSFALSGDVHELSEDEIQEIVNFAKFMRQQRKLRNQNRTSDGDKKDG